MAYAERTTVPYGKTIRDIITLVKKAGAVQVGQMEQDKFLTIVFGLDDRQIRFRVTWENSPSSQRQRARALMLVIKAKLESVASEVETFEQAFLANIVLSDGKTVHERVSGDLRLEYSQGQPAVYLIGGPSHD